MAIVWDRGEVNVRDTSARLSSRVAYTTVMTTLDRLFKKGLLARRKVGRAFVYRATATKDELEGAVATELHSLLQRDGGERCRFCRRWWTPFRPRSRAARRSRAPDPPEAPRHRALEEPMTSAYVLRGTVRRWPGSGRERGGRRRRGGVARRSIARDTAASPAFWLASGCFAAPWCCSSRRSCRRLEMNRASSLRDSASPRRRRRAHRRHRRRPPWHPAWRRARGARGVVAGGAASAVAIPGLGIRHRRDADDGARRRLRPRLPHTT